MAVHGKDTESRCPPHVCRALASHWADRLAVALLFLGQHRFEEGRGC